MKRKKKFSVETHKEMVDSFLNRWESCWVGSENFNVEERKAIKNYLSESALARFIETNKLSFSSSDLDEAIALASEAVSSDDYSVEDFVPELGLDMQCMEFITFFISRWDRADEFSRSEMELIWSRIYSKLAKHYQAHNYMSLVISKKDISQAIDAVSEMRNKQAIEATADRRDREIRLKRQQFGVVAHSEKHITY